MTLTPQTSAGPGEVLWGDAPRKQPIVPMIALAIILLLVAAPSAMSSNGSSSNPIVLMKQIASSTYEITGLMKQSNDSLGNIDSNIKPLVQLQGDMVGIADASAGMASKTSKLSTELKVVGGAVKQSKGQLQSVDTGLADTAAGMGVMRGAVKGSLDETRGVVEEFRMIDVAIGDMNSNLKGTIKLMSQTGPLTKQFANNKTRLAIAGGDSKKFGIPNLAPNNRVMTIMLPLINTMQKGGPLPARKDSATGSNFLVDRVLKFTVPDGTNVVTMIRPYDGFYGLPGPEYFVNNQVNGF